MKKNILFILIILNFISKGQPGFVWAKQIGGSNWAGSNGIAIDAQGNVYTAGQFAGIVDFDPGPGVNTLTCTSSSADIFISKLDANGNFIWARNIGGTRYNSAYAITVDVHGNVYTTGTFINNVDFDPGSGTYYLNSSSCLNDYSAFISKLDSAGNFIWAKAIQGPGYEWGMSIAVDANENVYTAGCFWSTTDFDPGPGVYNLSATSGRDMFISKLDAAGNFIWAKQFCGNQGGVIYSLALDAFANVYTTGSFYSVLDLDPGPGVFNLSSKGLCDIFVSKLDSSGNFIWAEQAGGKGNDEGRGINTGSNGSVFICGSFEDTASFRHGSGVNKINSLGKKDIFIWKLHSSSNLFWVKSVGSDSNDVAYSIAAGPLGAFCVTGEFGDTADFNPGPGIADLYSHGGSDIFVSKYNGGGNFLCAGNLGGRSKDVAYSVAVDILGNAHITGTFSDTCDFDPGNSVYDLSTNAKGVFISKLSACLSNTDVNTFDKTEDQILLFPNPAAGIVFVQSKIEITGIKVFNILGEQVSNLSFSKNEIDLRLLPKGIYFVEINADGKRVTQKIILE